MNFMSGRSGLYEEATGTYHIHDAYGGAATAPPLPNSSTTYIGGGREDATDDSDDHLQLHRRGGGEGNSSAVEREHMFDKIVTPSDVGKLNRLVIPKQHAEKYFPLDPSTNEKGLLLNFEDRNGKPWRFRYSYWNSSQSYVMTKGWSRFVKEKKLEAGDVVSFQRGVGESGRDRLFIDWRRRPDALPLIPTLPFPHHLSFHRSVHPWSPLFIPPPPTSAHPRHHFPAGYGGPYSRNPCPPGPILCVWSEPGGGGGGVYGPQQTVPSEEQMVFESVPVVQGKAAAAKRLRLFGVNMDCPISESDDSEILSSTTLAHPILPSPPSDYPSSFQLRPHYSHEDIDKGKSSMSLDLDI